MNTRSLGLAVALAVGFVLGVWLTQLFLEHTSPTEPKRPRRPSIITASQQVNDQTTAPITPRKSTRSIDTMDGKTTAPEQVTHPKEKTIRHWWTGLAGKQCYITLGKTSSLRIRQGTLTDGDQINWNESFGKNRQIGTLFNEADNTVFVHGVGIDARGLPVAAQITHTLDDSEVTGIISLSANDLQVSLYPVDDKN